MTLNQYHDPPMSLEDECTQKTSRKEEDVSVLVLFMWENVYRDGNDFWNILLVYGAPLSLFLLDIILTTGIANPTYLEVQTKEAG